MSVLFPAINPRTVDAHYGVRRLGGGLLPSAPSPRPKNVIDRTFYRSRLDYRRTVSDLSAALTSLLDLDEILGRVGRTVTDGLQLQVAHGAALAR